MRLIYLVFFIVFPVYAQSFTVPERMIEQPSAYKADLAELIDYLSSLTSDQQSPLYRSSAYWAGVHDVARTTDIDYQTLDCPAFRCFVVSAGQWSDGHPLRVVSFDWLVTVSEQREVVDARLIKHLNFSRLGDSPPLGNDSFVFKMDFPEKFNKIPSFCIYYRHDYNSAFDDSFLVREEMSWFSYLVKIESSGIIYQHKVSSYNGSGGYSVCDDFYFYYMGFDYFIDFIKTQMDHSRFNNEEYWFGWFFLEPVSTINVVNYNDIAYYLSEGGYHTGAIFILNEILEKFPNRTVAYINLGDAYWGSDQRDEARSAYQTYIRLMRESNREQRIPQRVFERVGEPVLVE